MPWGAAIGAVAAIGAASITADSTSSAADSQAASSAEATAERRRQFDISTARSQPWVDTGKLALNELAKHLGLDGSSGSLTKRYTGESLASDPGFKFGLDQTTKAVDNSFAAKGGLYSGAAGKAMAKYVNDYAGTKFNEGFNRDNIERNRTFNQLSGVAGTGQVATSQLNTLGANMANANAGDLIGVGDARASSYLARGSAVGNALNSLAPVAANYFRNTDFTGATGADTTTRSDPYSTTVDDGGWTY
jgi:hypothetical protein